MLNEAQKMFSNMSTPSSDLGNSMGKLAQTSIEDNDRDDDDFLPPPPVSLYNAGGQGIISSPAPKAQPPAPDPAESAVAENWLRVAGTQGTTEPSAAAATEKPSTGMPTAYCPAAGHECAPS